MWACTEEGTIGVAINPTCVPVVLPESVAVPGAPRVCIPLEIGKTHSFISTTGTAFWSYISRQTIGAKRVRIVQRRFVTWQTMRQGILQSW